MRLVLTLLLLLVGLGCSSPDRQATPTESAVASQKHPLADRVEGKVILRDGRVVAGSIHWRESRREYMVWMTHPPYHLSFAADRVARIEVEAKIEQSESTVPPEAAPNASSAIR